MSQVTSLCLQRTARSFYSKRDEFEKKLAEADTYLQVLIDQVEVRCILHTSFMHYAVVNC